MDHYTPFESSPALRWFLLLVLIPSAAIFPFLPIHWTPSSIVVMAGLEAFLCLIIIALLVPSRSHLMWRLVCGLIFVSFVAYFISELHGNGWKLGPLGRRSGASASNALAGLIAVGLPCLRYSVRGRLLGRGDMSENAAASDGR